MAYLVGGKSPATVCHYERLSREPDLRAALAYEVVFGVPARELFPGIYQEVEKEVTTRAQELKASLGEGTGTAGASHKTRLITALVAPKAEAPAPNP